MLGEPTQSKAKDSEGLGTLTLVWDGWIDGRPNLISYPFGKIIYHQIVVMTAVIMK